MSVLHWFIAYLALEALKSFLILAFFSTKNYIRRKSCVQQAESQDIVTEIKLSSNFPPFLVNGLDEIHPIICAIYSFVRLCS